MREKSHATERPYLLPGLFRGERVELILLVSRSILSVVARATVASDARVDSVFARILLFAFGEGASRICHVLSSTKNARFRSSCDFVPSCCFRHLSRLALSRERALGTGSPMPWRKN